MPLAALDETPFTHVVGIDEAGRGCLAGPVVAAAVMLPDAVAFLGLTDSKALTATQRTVLEKAIRHSALAWGLGVVWQRDIDRINILQATFTAMARAVACLKRVPQMLLVDGNMLIPPHILAERLPHAPRQRALVDGDALDSRISAASILAKTFRDRVMDALHKRYPAYGFLRHKGYGTAEHRAALAAHGPCPLHRLTFAGVLPVTRPLSQPAQGVLL